jgi:hypothetical protein
MKNFLYGTIIFLQLVQLNFLPLLREKYGYNIDPEYVSMLNIQFGENQKVIKYSLIQM